MSKRRGGYKAKKNGDRFEEKIKLSAYKLGWACEKIPTGSKTFKNFIIREKSPFDFVLGKNKRSVFFDAKSIESGNFNYSKIKPTQVARLLNWERQGFYAGYIVRYGQDNSVYFYSASVLYALRKRESLDRESGLYLGTDESIHFDLFENDNILLSCPIRKNAV